MKNVVNWPLLFSLSKLTILLFYSTAACFYWSTSTILLFNIWSTLVDVSMSVDVHFKALFITPSMVCSTVKQIGVCLYICPLYNPIFEANSAKTISLLMDSYVRYGQLKIWPQVWSYTIIWFVLIFKSHNVTFLKKIIPLRAKWVGR